MSLFMCQPGWAACRVEEGRVAVRESKTFGAAKQNNTGLKATLYCCNLSGN